MAGRRESGSRRTPDKPENSRPPISPASCAVIPLALSAKRGIRNGALIPLPRNASMAIVKLVGGDWNQAFVDELCAFPSGAHDDQVDAASARVPAHCYAALRGMRGNADGREHFPRDSVPH